MHDDLNARVARSPEFAVRLVIRLFRFGAGAPECWRIVLF